jgi:hypothetical protein
MLVRDLAALILHLAAIEAHGPMVIRALARSCK